MRKYCTVLAEVIVCGCRLLQTVESLLRTNGVLRNITDVNYPRSLAELSKNYCKTICYISDIKEAFTNCCVQKVLSFYSTFLRVNVVDTF